MMIFADKRSVALFPVYHFFFFQIPVFINGASSEVFFGA